MKKINRMTLSDADYEIYSKCEMKVSDEHPMKCICGRLATGLHERTCPKYRKAVDKLFIKTMKKSLKGDINEKY